MPWPKMLDSVFINSNIRPIHIVVNWAEPHLTQGHAIVTDVYQILKQRLK